MSQSINIWNMVDADPTSARRPSQLIPTPTKPTSSNTTNSMSSGGIPQAIGPHPLFKGVEDGNLAGVKDLILRGAAVDVKDFAGRSLLHRACELGEIEIVRFLLERKGAYLSATDRRNWTALHFAIANGDMEICKMLLSTIENMGDVPSMPDGNRPLHFLCNFPQTEDALYEEILYTLIASGVDVNAQNQYGETPLHIACIRLNASAVQLLLKNNASTWIRNKYGKGETCLHLIAKQGNVFMLRMLLQAGADPTLMGPEGTPSEVARMYNHPNAADEIEAFLAKINHDDLAPANLYLPSTPSVHPIQLSSKARVGLASSANTPRQQYSNLYNHQRSQTVSTSTPNLYAPMTDKNSSQAPQPPVRSWQTTLPQGYKPHQPQLQSHLQTTTSTSSLPVPAPTVTPTLTSPRSQPQLLSPGAPPPSSTNTITWQQIHPQHPQRPS